MDGEQADDGDTDPDAQEMEADGEPEMGGEGDEGMLPVRPNRLPTDVPDFNYLRFTEKHDEIVAATDLCDADEQIGRASCRERGCQNVTISGVVGSLKKKNTNRVRQAE